MDEMQLNHNMITMWGEEVKRPEINTVFLNFTKVLSVYVVSKYKCCI